MTTSLSIAEILLFIKKMVEIAVANIAICRICVRVMLTYARQYRRQRTASAFT